MTETLRTLASEYQLPVPALKRLLELTDAPEHDPDVPLRPRVVAVYVHVLGSMGFDA
jgi:hypothetical protein